MDAPVPGRSGSRWLWLALSVLVSLVAAGALLALHQAARDAHRRVAAAHTYSVQISQSMTDLAPLMLRLARTDRPLMRETVARAAQRADFQLGGFRKVAPARAAEIDRLLGRIVTATRNGEFNAGSAAAAMNAGARIANIAEDVAKEQGRRARRAEQISLFGGFGALAFAVLMVGALVGQERKRASRIERAYAAEVSASAQVDTLTALPNRHRFALDVEERRIAGEPVEVTVCDLNGFKEINYRLGHEAGDAVLMTVASDLRAAVGADATVYRTGGDQFSLLAAPGRRIPERVREALERDRNQALGTVGSANWPADHENIREVVRLADQRMYAVKRVLGTTTIAGATADAPPAADAA